MKRVLIVDDEESMRLLLRRVLESNPALAVTLADGAAEALKLTAERAYDLILLDLLMPGTGGIEVLTRIRNGSANRKTPVIIISVMADAPTKIACESLGVSDYLVKPIDREAVLAAVNGVITR
ncbi:MAG TPA: response regulator [Burkholderiales bacterium]|nr:response regulator [Burkholderiales bacterium]